MIVCETISIKFEDTPLNSENDSCSKLLTSFLQNLDTHLQLLKLQNVVCESIG